MKYGASISARSVPQWRAYNVDYDELKSLIRKYTSKSTLSQAEAEQKLFKAFLEQYELVSLFVKSKSGEIVRRIEHCENIVDLLADPIPPRESADSNLPPDNSNQLSAQTAANTSRNALIGIENPANPAAPAPPSSSIRERMRRKRLAQLSLEVDRLSRDLQDLSRFIGVQRTAFKKLLKKYKKWTHSDGLSALFLPVLNAPESFAHWDLTPMVLELSLLYNVLRKPTLQPLRSARNAETALFEFDRNFLSCNMSDGSSDAHPNVLTFWVHADNLVEVKLNLLRHMSIVSDANLSFSAEESTSPTGGIRRSASGNSLSRKISYKNFRTLEASQTQKSHYDSQEEETPIADGSKEVCVVYLDDTRKLYAVQTNSEPAQVRWFAEGTPAGYFLYSPIGGLRGFASARLKSGLAGQIVSNTLQTAEDPLRDPEVAAEVAELDNLDRMAVEWVRKRRVSPLTKIVSSQLKYESLDSSPEAPKIYAVLDSDIRLFGDSDAVCRLEPTSAAAQVFPHSVLQIRWPNSVKTPPEWVKELAQSHLLYQVSGFSLYLHSIAEFKQEALSFPVSWQAILDAETDIRKVPERPVRRKEPKPITNASEAATESTQSAPVDPLNENANSPTPGQSQIRYWNEFDHPDEEEDAGFYIEPETGSDISFFNDTSLDFLMKFSDSLLSAKRTIQSWFGIRPTEAESPYFGASHGSSAEDSESVTPEIPSEASALLASGRRLSRSYSNYRTLDDLYTMKIEHRDAVLTFFYCAALFLSALVSAIVTSVIIWSSNAMSQDPFADPGENVLTPALVVFIVIGLVFSLLLCGFASVLFLRRIEAPGLFHQVGVFFTVFTVICVAVGGIVWTLSAV